MQSDQTVDHRKIKVWCSDGPVNNYRSGGILVMGSGLGAYEVPLGPR